MLKEKILICTEIESKLVKQIIYHFKSKNIDCTFNIEEFQFEDVKIYLIIGIHDTCKEAFELAIEHACKVVLVEPDFLENSLGMLFREYYTIVYSTCLISSKNSANINSFDDVVHSVVFNSNDDIIDLCEYVFLSTA